jgi:hypothetical protein
MLLWGARALLKPAQNWAPGERWIRGASLVLLGAVMLVTSRVPFTYVGASMGMVAVILILRGVAGAGLALRTR